ncbi:hypothetical protein AHF37_11264 [Paragonimus kellicotti]|nr:hypothetical protein AHF37_11264 [Paragonimus kellicotti]
MPCRFSVAKLGVVKSTVSWTHAPVWFVVCSSGKRIGTYLSDYEPTFVKTWTQMHRAIMSKLVK